MTSTKPEAPPIRRRVLLPVVVALLTCWLAAGLAPARSEGAAAGQPAGADQPAAAAAPAEPGAPAAAEAAPQAQEKAPPKEKGGTGLYMNPVWLAVFIISTCVWLFVASWACGDARGIGMDYPVVMAAMLGVGWAGFLLMVLIHAALGFFLILLMAGATAVYIVKRNARVPTQHKLLGAYQLEQKFGKVPILKGLVKLGAKDEPQRMSVPLHNARDVYLSSIMAEQPAFAQAGPILADLVVRAGTTQTRRIRVAFAGESYVAQFTMDGVVHNVETYEPELGQQLLACASVFLGLASEGRMKQGAGKMTAEMAGGEKLEIDAQVTAIDGKPGLVLDFPNWTANLHKKGLESLGVHGAVLKRLQTAAQQSKGAVVVCGPPGSGKTTTLYGISSLIDIFTTDVIAVEKQPEGELVSIRHWPLPTDKPTPQIFAELMREAPQAIMWGEITQAEEAAHLMPFAAEEGFLLTTLRAPDAASALLSLAKMAQDPKLVSRAVSCIISQRLVRRLCVSCREQVEPNPELLAKLKLDPAAPGQWFRPVGCAACLNCGFRGQIGIYEMLIVTEPVAKALAAGNASAAAIRTAAGEGALRSMYQDGLTKVTAGITTLEEIRRVLTQPAGKPAKKAGGSQ